MRILVPPFRIGVAGGVRVQSDVAPDGSPALFVLTDYTGANLTVAHARELGESLSAWAKAQSDGPVALSEPGS